MRLRAADLSGARRALVPCWWTVCGAEAKTPCAGQALTRRSLASEGTAEEVKPRVDRAAEAEQSAGPRPEAWPPAGVPDPGVGSRGRHGRAGAT